MNQTPRIVFTGTGAVCGSGLTIDAIWDAIVSGRSAVAPLSRWDTTGWPCRIAAEIPDFRPQDHLDAKRAKRLDRFSQLAVTSARFALTDAV